MWLESNLSEKLNRGERLLGPEATASVKAGATLGQCGAEEGKVRKLFHMSERHPMKSWEQVASLFPNPQPPQSRAWRPRLRGCFQRPLLAPGSSLTGPQAFPLGGWQVTRVSRKAAWR